MSDWGFEGYDLSAFNGGKGGAKGSGDPDASGGASSSGTSDEIRVNAGPGSDFLKSGWISFLGRRYEEARWYFEKAADLGIMRKP